MAYGDGGFFFTQPVGNGYSGLGAFGAAGPAMGSSSSSVPTPVGSYCLDASAVCTPDELRAELARIEGIWSSRGVTVAQRRTSTWWPTYAALRQKLIAKESGSRVLPSMRTPVAPQVSVPSRSQMTVPSAPHMSPPVAELTPQDGSSSSPLQMTSPEFLQRMGFNVTTTPTTPEDTTVTTEDTYSTYTTSDSGNSLEYWAQQSSAGAYAPVQPMEVNVTPLPAEAFAVGGEIEEPTGIMGWISQNYLLAGAIAAGVGYFGYREAKKRGMI